MANKTEVTKAQAEANAQAIKAAAEKATATTETKATEGEKPTETAVVKAEENAGAMATKQPENVTLDVAHKLDVDLFTGVFRGGGTLLSHTVDVKHDDIVDENGQVVGQQPKRITIKPNKASSIKALLGKDATMKDVEATRLTGGDSLKQSMAQFAVKAAHDDSVTGHSVTISRSKNDKVRINMSYVSCERQIDEIKKIADAYGITKAEAIALLEDQAAKLKAAKAATK